MLDSLFFLDFPENLRHTGFMKNESIENKEKTYYTDTDLHTHTIASGHATTDTIALLAKAAFLRGMKCLGISDHGPASMGSAGLSYFRSLSLSPGERAGVELLYGVEANILDFSGSLDIPDSLLQTLDYGIISMHRPIYTSGSVRENTLAYQKAMTHPRIKIIGHCDDSRFPVDYAELVRTALEYRVVPEINNVSLLPDSYRKNCRSNAIRLLSECESQGCPVVLSSDSHGHLHIGDVTESWKLILETGFPAELVINPPVLS